MIWQMTWGLIALGILSLAIFVWRMTRRARLLDLIDIVLLGFGRKKRPFCFFELYQKLFSE